MVVAEGEHESSIDRSIKDASVGRELEIGSIVSDLEALVIRLDQLGLGVAAARASYALDFLKKSSR